MLLPKILVEQPTGNTLATGARVVFFGNALAATSAPLRTFTLRNSGNANLTGIGVQRDGAHSSDFAVNTVGMTTPLAPGAATTFSVTFTPAAAGARAAVLHIASNDPLQNPLDISLTGTGFALGIDTDGDGMDDWPEVQLASLGFAWQVSQPALVQAYFDAANLNGLYNTSQVRALNVGTPLLYRDSATGRFKLTLALKKSANLAQWDAFPFTHSGTAINGHGEIEFEFAVPDTAAFFRVQAE